jgi:hypothetical protein
MYWMDYIDIGRPRSARAIQMGKESNFGQDNNKNVINCICN